ncbi:CotD family spore coat protein [Oceanobacillus sp. J11TS1]|uniref:CotD family spore coat protein n=1 Tax=Oceanobacillus sp. J11TS1 TaxID=2807191 RepID=UPI001BB40E48|nr:CotD family spore coat protein [Oceanobacillus sp. J11TS1]
MQGRGRFNQPHRNEQTIVHPTKHQYVHTSSESVVHHIHPVHTTYIHHPSIKNQHPRPHGMQPFWGRQPMGSHPQFRFPPIVPPEQMPWRMGNHPRVHPFGRPRPW